MPIGVFLYIFLEHITARQTQQVGTSSSINISLKILNKILQKLTDFLAANYSIFLKLESTSRCALGKLICVVVPVLYNCVMLYTPKYMWIEQEAALGYSSSFVSALQ